MMFKLQLISLFLLLGGTSGLRLQTDETESQYTDTVLRLTKHARKLHNGVPNDQLVGVFNNMKELEAAGWKEYIDRVYKLSTITFPFDIGALHFFYHEALPEKIRKNLIFPLQCNHGEGPLLSPQKGHTIQNGHLYRLWGGERMAGRPVDIWRCYRPDCVVSQESKQALSYARQSNVSSDKLSWFADGFPDGTKVEVTHRGYADHAWMYWAKGSGIFYDLGKTIAFVDRGEAAAHFGRSLGAGNSVGEIMSAAAEHGYDSVQFTNFAGENIFKYEIVDTHAVFTSSGCPKDSSQHRFHSGWMGLSNCQCATLANECLNCDNFPRCDPALYEEKRKLQPDPDAYDFDGNPL